MYVDKIMIYCGYQGLDSCSGIVPLSCVNVYLAVVREALSL